MTLKEFEIKNGIYVTSGIMPIKLSRQRLPPLSSHTGWQYAFRYTNLSTTETRVLLIQLVSDDEWMHIEFYTDTISINIARDLFIEDTDKQWLNPDEQIFMDFLDWYCDNINK